MNTDSHKDSAQQTPTEGTQEDLSFVVNKLKENMSKLTAEQKAEFLPLLIDDESVRREAVKTVRASTIQLRAVDEAKRMSGEATRALEAEVGDLRTKLAELVSTAEAKRLENMDPDERESHITKTQLDLTTAELTKVRRTVEAMEENQGKQDIIAFAADDDEGLGFSASELEELAKATNSAEMQARMIKIQSRREKARRQMDKSGNDDIKSLRAQLDELKNSMKGGTSFIETSASSVSVTTPTQFEALQNEYGDAIAKGDNAKIADLGVKYAEAMRKVGYN